MNVHAMLIVAWRWATGYEFPDVRPRHDLRYRVTGTQEVEVVATRGTFAEGRNLRLVLTPESPPEYTTYPSCDQPPMKVKAPNGIEWLWFCFDYYRGGNIDVHLPDKPGGTWTWDYAPSPQPELAEPGGCGQLEFLRCEHTTTLTVEYH